LRRLTTFARRKHRREAALDRDILSLLRRRLGPRGAFAGVGLHTVHQLTAAAAVPAGLISGLHAPARRRSAHSTRLQNRRARFPARD
jgi:hypothetical protein